MKDFINKLELAFDKQLADKTNYGRNQVKELFLRACIEVLADTRVSKTPSKEEGEESSVHHRPRPKHKQFIDPVTEELIEANFYRQPDCEAWGIDFVNDDENIPVITGETNLDNPSIEDLITLYHFYKEQLPF